MTAQLNMRLLSINSCKDADAPKKEMYVLAEHSRNNRVNDVEKANETSPKTSSENETVADVSNNA